MLRLVPKWHVVYKLCSRAPAGRETDHEYFVHAERIDEVVKHHAMLNHGAAEVVKLTITRVGD